MTLPDTAKNPVPERSESVSEELQGNPLHESTETENKNKNERREEAQSDLLHDLPDWVQEFRENLVDERSSSELWGNPELGYRDTSSSSHELPMESRAVVVPHALSEGPKLRYLLEDENNECILHVLVQSCPKAETFGDLITADHKILSKGSESRDNHRDAVVVQDLATEWLRSYPCKTKTSQETTKNLVNFLEPTRKPKVIYTDNSLEFGKSCEEVSWNHCSVNTTQIRSIWDS